MIQKSSGVFKKTSFCVTCQNVSHKKWQIIKNCAINVSYCVLCYDVSNSSVQLGLNQQCYNIGSLLKIILTHT